MAWARRGHGTASVNQTRPHCVNQMRKTHFKHLAVLHVKGTEWGRHGHGMLCVNRPLPSLPFKDGKQELLEKRTIKLTVQIAAFLVNIV
jgi:hypothetical protein